MKVVKGGHPAGVGAATALGTVEGADKVVVRKT